MKDFPSQNRLLRSNEVGAKNGPKIMGNPLAFWRKKSRFGTLAL
jgi:hypothetical protein